jgi:hypothetical protein
VVAGQQVALLPLPQRLSVPKYSLINIRKIVVMNIMIGDGNTCACTIGGKYF